LFRFWGFTVQRRRDTKLRPSKNISCSCHSFLTSFTAKHKNHD